MSKKEIALVRARLMAEYEHIFRCPVCSRPMKMNCESSLTCTANHNFDLSKEGYIHLLLKTRPTKYDKELFAARKLIHASGYFDPLLDGLADMISGGIAQQATKRPLSILDAGCGEGSHLASLQRKLSFLLHPDILAVGADLSKPGIAAASKGHSPIIWCVTDLAHSPFQDQTFQIIVNILSPSSYGEFQRLLSANGMLVKVIPGPEYLQEFRQILYGKSAHGPKEASEETATLFAKHFPEMKQLRIRYELDLNPLHLTAMLRMTPLSWNAPEEKTRQLLLTKHAFKLTFDFYILWGKHVMI
ncbi:methyltransferase domain-containing protein [Paenibacillus dokdonensis]|uniref:Methyltransferase domain-containing protein n=1 Tax=Paenibacillus dokdonensis TaxID=2567944 RepID=A0ABU6GQE1_9BACL|nr:methyltransferase domain-containing protein [Paenibacillus dokdonensis]MEC0240940.1 methyltransferase domain-containing protein [Paenibacillus dokdonensis]